MPDKSMIAVVMLGLFGLYQFFPQLKALGSKLFGVVGQSSGDKKTTENLDDYAAFLKLEARADRMELPDAKACLQRTLNALFGGVPAVHVNPTTPLAPPAPSKPPAS